MVSLPKQLRRMFISFTWRPIYRRSLMSEPTYAAPIAQCVEKHRMLVTSCHKVRIIQSSSVATILPLACS